jgi:hypothetical protein
MIDDATLKDLCVRACVMCATLFVSLKDTNENHEM